MAVFYCVSLGAGDVAQKVSAVTGSGGNGDSKYLQTASKYIVFICCIF